MTSMTQEVCLQITYRRGKPLAGYQRLGGREGDRVARSRKAAPGLVVDYDRDGRPLGLEITSPSSASVQEINQVLCDLHLEALPREELLPLAAH